jgi:ABC-type nitrate/sulfonate/bicarbonate transport system substrate-binding protein
VKLDGTVACWGRDQSWESTAPAGTFKQLAAGQYTTCGVGIDDTIQCWNGLAGYAPPPSGPARYVAVGRANGASYACAVMKDGRIACWGDEGR